MVELPLPLGGPPATLSSHFAVAAPEVPTGDDDCGELIGAVDRLLDLLDTLSPVDAALARGCLPRRDSTCGAGLALFLAAVSGGCRAWLGEDAAAALTGLDGGLMLDDCDQALAPRFQRIDGRDWRVSRVPLADGCGCLLVAVEVEDGLADGVSLMMQARTRRLGPVQLMATMAGRRIDVTLRLAIVWPSAVLADLHDSFHDALEACRVEGRLTVGPLADVWLALDAPMSSDIAL